jgi:uncharacterized protein (TIGR02118 family)
MSVKMIFCIRRLPGLDPAEFSRYWRYEHAALFADHAVTLRAKRYTQSHRTLEGLNDALRAHRTAPDGYDGVAEVWFDNIDDLKAALSTPAARAAGEVLIVDERRFIDHAASPIWIADEVLIDIPNGSDRREG